ncbi:MAG: hypothetical protein U7127_28600 [Phormidium sp.]
MEVSKQSAIAYLELIKMRSDLGIHRSAIAYFKLIKIRSDLGIHRSAIAFSNQSGLSSPKSSSKAECHTFTFVLQPVLQMFACV